MKKFLILFLLISVKLYSYFDYNIFSVKAYSMGNITTANLTSSDSVFYNPALLNYVTDINLSINFFSLYPDIINNSIYTYNISAAKDISGNGIGLGYHAFHSDNYSETLLIGGYSRKLSFFSSGISVKYGSVGFEPNVKNDVGLETVLHFFTFTIGILFSQDTYKFGIVAANLFSNKTGISYDEPLNRRFSIGGSYKFTDYLDASAELEYYDDYFDYKLGCSILAVKNILTLNSGINKHSFNFGFSFKYTDLYVDYGLQYDFNFVELNSTQMIGVRINL